MKISYLAGTLALIAPIVGCWRSSQPTRAIGVRSSVGSKQNADVLLNGIATTLNDLTNRVDLELNPEQPILTARTTDDGNEVLATCAVNPYQAEAGFSYLQVPSGSVNFRDYDVKQGDIVRYYVNLDQEAAERGFEDRKAVRLRVRRVDHLNPSALILEGGLTGPVLEPQRMEIWRLSDERLDAIRNILQRYYARRRPAVGWEPSPDAGELERLVDRCNQWWQNQMAVRDDWRLDPLVETLPADLRQNEHVARQLSENQLRSGRFAETAGRRMQQAVWCRDIARWARGGAARKPEVTAALFDWTVRHVQLVEPDDAAMIHHPWQALMYGRGAAEHRAWVFVELCRQQQIDAVVLAVKDENGDAHFWLPAALIDDDLYLFDAQMGLPVPSPDDGVAATLAEVIADPDLLDEFSVESEFEYPISANHLGQLEAWLVASPEQLSRRYAKLQKALEGENFVVLAADNAEFSDQLTALKEIEAVKLWQLPYQAIIDQYEIKPSARKAAVEVFEPFAVRPRLWKARTLHFLGRKDVAAADRGNPLAAPQLGHQEAFKLYMDRHVRPPDKVLQTLDADKRSVYDRTKATATYWLGVLSYDRGSYDVSINWLSAMIEDEATEVGDPDADVVDWQSGSRYNLARAFEAAGDFDRAITLLQSDPPTTPGRPGNLVRARQLHQRQQSDEAGDDGAAD